MKDLFVLCIITTHLHLKSKLGKDKSVTHHRNIQTLAIEMYKAKNNLSPQITQDIFQIRNTVSQSKTVNYGTESIKFMGPKIWNILPKSYKEAQTLNKFKLDIKLCIPSKLCKHYNLGH